MFLLVFIFIFWILFSVEADYLVPWANESWTVFWGNNLKVSLRVKSSYMGIAGS